MQSVLIVDESPEVREVIRTALARRGVQIFEASRSQQGVALARQHHPDVIVVDMEAETADARHLSADFTAASPQHPPSLVLLGTARRLAGAKSAGGEFISKPYHYAPLIRKIESLLAG